MYRGPRPDLTGQQASSYAFSQRYPFAYEPLATALAVRLTSRLSESLSHHSKKTPMRKTSFLPPPPSDIITPAVMCLRLSHDEPSSGGPSGRERFSRGGPHKRGGGSRDGVRQNKRLEPLQPTTKPPSRLPCSHTPRPEIQGASVVSVAALNR